MKKTFIAFATLIILAACTNAGENGHGSPDSTGARPAIDTGTSINQSTGQGAVQDTAHEINEKKRQADSLRD